MGIVVFYLRDSATEGAAPAWAPHCEAFDDSHMTQALARCQALRADARHAHVCISSELRDMVGLAGVSAVEDGRTPDGKVYDWSKAGRAGAVRRGR